MNAIDWPCYSPDLNPVEEVCAWLEMKVNTECPQTIFDLRQSIRKYWSLLTLKKIQKYINRLEKSIAK